jgi:NPCBM/NEW2 domain.
MRFLRVPLRARFLAGVVALACHFPAIGLAADYYWNPVDASINTWSSTTYWRPQPDGSGSAPAGFSSALSYSTNGKSLATPILSSGTATFGGGVLLLEGGQLSVKSSASGVARIPYLVSRGGVVVAAISSNVVSTLSVDIFRAAEGEVLLSAANDANNRALVLSIGRLVGSAPFVISPSSGDARTVRLSVNNGIDYTGAFSFSRGVVEFDNDLVSGGSLALDGTVRLSLKRSVTFASVVIDGVALPAGTHTYDDLRAAHPARFLPGGSGGITVAPVPAAVPVHASGLRLLRDTVVDASALNFASGTWGTAPNGQTFQQDGVVSYLGYQYAAYWSSLRRPAIARRALPDGPWETIVFDDYGPITHTNVHNVVAVGVSPSDGTIHLSFDQHATQLRYRRSIAGVATNPTAHAWTRSLFGATTSALIPGQALSTVTYPQFFTRPDGRLQFCLRDGGSGNGDWHLYEYADGAWQRLGMLFSRSGVYQGKTSRSAYPNQYRYDSAGRLHVTWVWRENGTDLTGNHDLAYAYSDDFGRTWRNNSENIIATLGGGSGAGSAISINTPGHVVLPVRYNWGLMNTTTQFTDSKGRVHTTLWRNPDDATSATVDKNRWRHYHCWRDLDGVWHMRLLPFQGRKPQLVVDDNGDIHVVHGIGPELNYEGVTPGACLAIATATEASGWTDWVVQPFIGARSYDGEPLIDYGRWERERVLSVYFQEHPVSTGQPSPLRVLDFAPTSRVYVGDLSLNDTARVTGAFDRDHNQGSPLALNGVSYPKGLGVVAPSELRVPLDRAYSRFVSDVGVNDAVGGGGAVVFEVWADDEKVFDSGILTGASPTRSIDVDLSGRAELRLVVTDTGHASPLNLADWAGARLIPAPPTPRQLWTSDHFGDEAGDPDIAGPLADPDGDGLPNLLEYAFDTDPRTADTGHAFPRIDTLLANGQTYLTLTFPRRAAVDAGVSYLVEESPDLASWTALELAPRLVGPPSDLGNGLELVTVRGDIPLGAGTRAFLRLRVTATSP